MGYETFMKFYPLTLEDLPDEVWEPIPDFGKYKVSNFGRVKSFHNSTVKILKPAISKYGYLRIELNERGKVKKFFVHRLVALCFIPNPQNKPYINHLDGHKLNCHVSNLEWCTSSENRQHAFDTGLIIKHEGQDHHRAKLTNKQVRYIRDNPDNLNQYELADLFGVCQSQISHIRHGEYYKRAGGSIHQARKLLPKEIRSQIRAEYQNGVRGFGYMSLAKKYNVSKRTIHDIIHKNEEA